MFNRAKKKTLLKITMATGTTFITHGC